MNALEFLRKDHEKVLAVMNKLSLVRADERLRRQDLFEQLKHELDLHSLVEETIFYPALKDFQETKKILDRSVQDHQQLSHLLEEMHEMPKIGKLWDTKLNKLKQDIHDHVAEEESELFPLAFQLLGAEKIGDLGYQMRDEISRQLVNY